MQHTTTKLRMSLWKGLLLIAFLVAILGGGPVALAFWLTVDITFIVVYVFVVFAIIAGLLRAAITQLVDVNTVEIKAK